MIGPAFAEPAQGPTWRRPHHLLLLISTFSLAATTRFENFFSAPNAAACAPATLPHRGGLRKPGPCRHPDRPAEDRPALSAATRVMPALYGFAGRRCNPPESAMCVGFAGMRRTARAGGSRARRPAARWRIGSVAVARADEAESERRCRNPAGPPTRTPATGSSRSAGTAPMPVQPGPSPPGANGAGPSAIASGPRDLNPRRGRRLDRADGLRGRPAIDAIAALLVRAKPAFRSPGWPLPSAACRRRAPGRLRRGPDRGDAPNAPPSRRRPARGGMVPGRTRARIRADGPLGLLPSRGSAARIRRWRLPGSRAGSFWPRRTPRRRGRSPRRRGEHALLPRAHSGVRAPWMSPAWRPSANPGRSGAGHARS